MLKGHHIKGPFADCLQMLNKLYIIFEKNIARMKAASDPDAQAWSNVLTSHLLILDSTEESDNMGLFVLLDALEDRISALVDDIDHRRRISTDQETLSKKAALQLFEAIEWVKDRLLAHPINIIMAAFLVGDKCLYDYNKVVVKADLEEGSAMFRLRTAESFIKTFPYNYLAAVYKISFEIYVNKRYEMPTSSWLYGATCEAMNVFHERAKEDIYEVR